MCAMLSFDHRDHLDFGVRARAFVLLRGARYFSFACPKEKYPRENDTPLGACRPSMGGKSVSRGRAFRPDSCPGEKESTSLSTPLRACRPRLTAAQGPRVEQRAILARTRYATAALWRKLRSQEQESPAASRTFSMRIPQFGVSRHSRIGVSGPLTSCQRRRLGHCFKAKRFRDEALDDIWPVPARRLRLTVLVIARRICQCFPALD